MAFDEHLAARIRALTATLSDTAEKRMFGGWGLMWRGNLLIGVIGDRICARIGPDAYGTALEEHGVAPFDYSGRPMTGWVFIDVASLDDAALGAWIERCKAFVGTLPEK